MNITIDTPLIPFLVSIREKLGLTQADIAARTDWSQSKVSKLEQTKDMDARLLDVHRYARALGLEMRISFPPLKKE